MQRLISTSHFFLGLSAISTIVGLLHVFAPEYVIEHEGLSKSRLDDEVFNVLYRSYGSDANLSLNYSNPHRREPFRMLTRFRSLAMLTLGAAYCALHQSPTTFALQTMGVMHVFAVGFSAWVARRPGHLQVSGGMPAIWGLVHLLVAIYMLTTASHRHHAHGHHAATVTVSTASTSPRRRGRSPARK